LKGVLGDLRKDYYGVAANKELTDLQKAFNEKVLPRMTLVSKHLGENDFLAGKLSLLDFSFAEMLGGVLLQDGDWLGSLPNLKTYFERVNNLPGLKEYNASGKPSAFYSAPGYLNEKIKVQKN
jgi:glutathione S-transferase